MLDQNDLQAIAQLMEQQKKDILEVVDQRTNSLLEVMQQQADTLQGMIKESEARINIKLENDVSKRIDSLFDERNVEQLEKRLEALEAKAG